MTATKLNELLRFLVDSLVCLVFAFVLIIPFINVALLRHFMNDSKSFSRQVKVMRVNDKSKAYFEDLMKSVR